MLLGVKVDPVLLVGCVIALLMGGLLGAPLVDRTRVWIVQLGGRRSRWCSRRSLMR